MKTVYIDGPLDAVHLEEVKEKIAEAQAQVGDIITLDCTEMSYICSSGLRVFLQMHKDVTAAGGKLIIKGLQPLVKNVFNMTGFAQVLNIEE
ncbi:MAG: STAS domain-containing protein [Bacteroidaceae bacterium]|nr:STAS domain-containing protein [Bacteroidaceae bacterium]